MFKKIIFGFFALLSSLQIQAQNNAIFFGGDGDGWTSGSHVQVADEAIFFGGEGDGWAMANYLQSGDEAIFLGGEDDGWAMNFYLQLGDESIFYGGEGDGWASVIYPLGPLPIELLSFTGRELNDFHILDWSTSMETNSSHFVIEHSINSIKFNELGMQNAAGNSSTERRYTFTNKNPNLGNNFYRLKMVDQDGKYKYSNIVLLKVRKDNSTLMVYPNPTASMINIDINGLAIGSKLEVSLMDASGKLIKSHNYTFDNQLFSMDVSSYANGLYFLKINGNSYSEIVKFSIKK
jgi:hypothetical protein